MKVLGIVTQHDSTVALIEDGVISFVQSEERFTRIKHTTGLPLRTIHHIYEHLAPPETIDLIVFYEKTITGYQLLKSHGFESFGTEGNYFDPETIRPSFKNLLLRTRPGLAAQRWRAQRREKNAALRGEADAYFANALQVNESKLRYLEHHQSHAYSVLPNIQEWDRTLVLTLDGYGDELCATVNLYENGEMRRLDATDVRHSLGLYYFDTTLILGMRALEDEFKVMGLAPYGSGTQASRILEKLRELLRVDEDGRWCSAPLITARFAALDRIYRYQRFDRIASAVQQLAEELVEKWVAIWIQKTGCRNVALAGGLFMNVKVNQRIAGLEEVERLFVMPSAGDESCAIGAAVWGALQCDPNVVIQPLTDLYLGVGFTDGEIEEACRSMGASERYDIARPEDADVEAGRLLAANEIVARCSGRMEFGARALGNRSILANAADVSNVRRINEAIKGRDFWMPFAPSILESDLSRYVVGSDRVFSPYMSVAFDSTAEARRELAAAVHPKDMTLRPQVVVRSWNPGYHRLIESFKSSTGTGGILNTSFNLHREPIVCLPADAIRTVDHSDLQRLVMGPYLLTKRNSVTRNE